MLLIIVKFKMLNCLSVCVCPSVCHFSCKNEWICFFFWSKMSFYERTGPSDLFHILFLMIDALSQRYVYSEPCFFILMKLSFLHLHEIVEGLYFHYSLSVCVCVYVSDCEQNANRTATPILTRSSLNSCLLQSLKPYQIGDLGSKVKVTVT